MNNNLKNNFAFYAAYHKNPQNQLIHVITIPIIIWTIFVGLAHLSISIPMTFYDTLISVNPSSILIIVYSLMYIQIDKLAALLMIFIIVGLYICANIFRYYKTNSLLWALITHIVGWIIQFAGHGVFEKRKPALIDGIVQAFTMAPLFALMECMFYFGYKPQLKKDIMMLSQKY